MKCYVQFRLTGCSVPYPDEYKVFHSISQAGREFLKEHRTVSGFSNGEPSEMWVFLGTPETDLPYPCDCLPDRVYRTTGDYSMKKLDY
jgi:hypothetical protein